METTKECVLGYTVALDLQNALGLHHVDCPIRSMTLHCDTKDVLRATVEVLVTKDKLPAIIKILETYSVPITITPLGCGFQIRNSRSLRFFSWLRGLFGY